MSETRMSEIYHVISTLILIYQFFFVLSNSSKKRRMRIKFHAKHPLIKYHSMINDDTYFSGYVSACLKDDMDSERSYVLGKKKFHLLCHSLSLRKFQQL